MKLIATVASLGLVAARPQGDLNLFPGQHSALDDLSSGLDGGLDASALGDVSVPDLTVNQSQLDDIVDDESKDRIVSTLHEILRPFLLLRVYSFDQNL
mgnify:CR=1 FL=1